MLLRCFLLVADIALTTYLAVADESAVVTHDDVNAIDDPLHEPETIELATRAKKKGALSLAKRAQALVEESVAAALKEEVLTGLYAPVGHLGHCPEGWSFIRNRTECSKAASYLAFKDRSDLEHGWPDRPGGCFLHDARGEVFFNNLMGSVSQQDRQICTSATAGKVGQTSLARLPSAKKARQTPVQDAAGNDLFASADEPEPEKRALEAQDATVESQDAVKPTNNHTQGLAPASHNATAPKLPGTKPKPKPELKDTKDGLSPHKMIPGYPHRPGGPNARPLKSANRFKPAPKQYDEDGELKDTPWGKSEDHKSHWKGFDIIGKILDGKKPHAEPQDYDEEGELSDTYNGMPAPKDYEKEQKTKNPYTKFKPGPPGKVGPAKADALKNQAARAKRDRIDRVHEARWQEEAEARRPIEKAAAKEAKAKRKANAKVKEARIKAAAKAEEDAEKARKKGKGKSMKAHRFDSGAGEEDAEGGEGPVSQLIDSDEGGEDPVSELVGSDEGGEDPASQLRGSDEGNEDPVSQLIGEDESRKLSSAARKYIADTIEYKRILGEELPGAVEQDRKHREEEKDKDEAAMFKEAAAYHAETMKQAKAMLSKKANDRKMKVKAHIQHRKVKLAEPGQRCDEGWQAVTNRTICKEAAASLGGQDYTSWPHKFTTRPYGCYMHPQPSVSHLRGQRQFNFNPSKEGDFNFEDQIVCMKTPEEKGHKTKLLEVESASRPLPPTVEHPTPEEESYWNQRVEETQVLHPERVSEEELIGPGEPTWKQAQRDQKRLVSDVSDTNKKEQKKKEQRLRSAAKYDQQIKKEADKKLKKMHSVFQGPFRLAEPGSRCPEYYLLVTNRTLCKQAAKLWEGKDMVDWQKTKRWTNRPNGCFVHKAVRDREHEVMPMEFNFNGGGKGDFSFQDQVVCVDGTSTAARKMALLAPNLDDVTEAHAGDEMDSESEKDAA